MIIYLLSVAGLVSLALLISNNVCRFYLATFIGYYGIGLYASNFIEMEVSLSSLILVYLASFSALSAGIILSCTLLSSYKTSSERYDLDIPIYRSPVLYLYCSASFWLAALGFALVIAGHGVPVMHPESRQEVPPYIGYLVALLWVNYPLAYCLFSRKIAGHYFFLCLIVFSLMGYRTPILIMFVLFFLLNLNWPRHRIRARRLLAICLLLVFVTGVFAAARYVDKDDLIDAADRIGVPSRLAVFAPIAFVFGEGYVVNSSIIAVHEKIGSQRGAFTLSGFSTVLPGEQLHARNQLAKWMGRSNWQQNSTVPTLVGQLYIEGGVFLVIFGLFVVGVFLGVFSVNILSKSVPITKFYVPAVIFVFLYLGIHTGLLDFIIFFSVIYYAAMLFVASYLRVGRENGSAAVAGK